METTTTNVYEREVDFVFFIRKLCGQFWTDFSTFLANSYALTWRIVAANILQRRNTRLKGTSTKVFGKLGLIIFIKEIGSVR